MRGADLSLVLSAIGLLIVLSKAQCVFADADALQAAPGSTDHSVPEPSGLANCLSLPGHSLDFGQVSSDSMEQWSGLTWPFLSNADYLALGQDESGLPYLRQKLEPTPQGSIHVVGKGVLRPAKTYTLSQAIYLEPGFDWGGRHEGGKLGFGLGGGSTPSGGKLSPDGFTLRLMWRGNHDGTAGLVAYAYSADRRQNLPYGDDYPLQDFQVPVGQWFTITLQVSSNSSITETDGRIRVWANGQLALDRERIHWQSAGQEPVIDTLIFATFHGGSSREWAPSSSVYARFGSVCWQSISNTSG